MNTDDLLRDPVFQLNLLVWMAKDQPQQNYRVRPVFRESGFDIVYIEQPFKFPDQTFQAIEACGLDISRQPEPELILARQVDNKALYFEAKSQGFGHESDNCKQARGHLLAAGPAFVEVYPPFSACLCYVVPDGDREPMTQTLTALLQELTGKSLSPGQSFVHGLIHQGNQISYAWDTSFATHLGMTDTTHILMDDVADDTDPSPLLLVYSDEDCPNEQTRDFYRSAFLNQVRAGLLCDLHALGTALSYSTPIDELLLRTTDGVFQFCGRQRQKNLRLLVKKNIGSAIVDYWKTRQPGNVTLLNDTLTLRWTTETEKQDFLNWLEDRKTLFPASRPASEALPLFDELESAARSIGDGQSNGPQNTKER